MRDRGVAALACQSARAGGRWCDQLAAFLSAEDRSAAVEAKSLRRADNRGV